MTHAMVITAIHEEVEWGSEYRTPNSKCPITY
jgi:hypothetical protein